MRVVSVSEFVEGVNAVLKEVFTADAVAVEGEVSGFRVSQGQWVTFDLKDDKALVNVFLTVWNLRVPVEDGFKVRVFGSPRVYPKYGKFSLSAERIELAGEGALRRALALLRARLAEEGLFDPSRKRELPRFPRRVAVIASRESAAYGDFCRILDERWRGLDVHLYHVLVQGERAPASIVAAIRAAQKGEYDALVVTRGGGSLEELMAFNDEQVVRAIRGSRIPTLVGIGHERDLTLAEEAADMRASTPTDCARRLVPDRRDVQYELSAMVDEIGRRMDERLAACDQALQRALRIPGLWLAREGERVRAASDAVGVEGLRWMHALEDRLSTQIRLLDQLNPERVLARGYAVVRRADGKIACDAASLRPGDRLRLGFRDGERSATVDGVPAQSALL